jgi:hypothetical protein
MRLKKLSKSSYLSFIDRFRQDIDETNPVSRVEPVKNNTNDENNEANKRYNSREFLLNMNSSRKEEYNSARKKFSLEKETEQKQIDHLKSNSTIGSNIDFTI